MLRVSSLPGAGIALFFIFILLQVGAAGAARRDIISLGIELIK
jgi:hypothetical protein